MTYIQKAYIVTIIASVIGVLAVVEITSFILSVLHEDEIPEIPMPTEYKNCVVTHEDTVLKTIDMKCEAPE